MTWYPVGRFVGGTVYPGLMQTAAILYKLAHLLGFTMDIRNLCVMISPFMASLTAIAAYLCTKEAADGSAGILAAAFIAIAPGYISRSVAGSYDNECVAIFALVFCFFLWLKSVNTGSMMWASLCALGYFNMVAGWGGYIFITNIIPIHVFALIASGRYSHRLYVAFCTYYILGVLLAMNVQFVGFKPVSSPEHLAAFGVFGLLQVYNFFYYVKHTVNADFFKKILHLAGLLVMGLVGVVILLALAGKVPALTGRLRTLLISDPGLAIIKSVSEHQPSSWTTFFGDLHLGIFMIPVGFYVCFKNLNDCNAFLILYALLASYFTSIMVRLVLVLTPASCMLAGIACAAILETYCDVIMFKEDAQDSSDSSSVGSDAAGESKAPGKKAKKKGGRRPNTSKFVAVLIILGLLTLFFFFTIHCTWFTSTRYSSPSIILQSTRSDGSLHIFDDFREGYAWLRHNTADDAKIMSWWDYGYQITGMGNRTVIVDNNTRNNTHIATVGLAMASNEARAYEIFQALDVDYVLVVFGGKIGYSSDDIAKFLWMVRISGGIFPEVVESDYLNERGGYVIDLSASKRMRQSIMFKMCYYRFGELTTVYGRPTGYDRTRNVEVGDKNIHLTHLEEAFTSEHWMVRIYRVKRDRTHPNFEHKLGNHLTKF